MNCWFCRFINYFITYIIWIGGTFISIITFFITFIGVKVTLVYQAIKTGGDLNATLDIVWDEQTEGLFAAIISFWFGSRAMPKIKALNR